VTAPLRLAHLSDLHLLDLGGVRVADFLNKRLAGGATLLLKRHRQHRQEVVEAALRCVEASSVDHLAITGDLSNLALASELERAARLLEPLGDTRRVSVVPGNHDCYTRESRGRFEATMARWLVGDAPGDRPWPWLKLLGPVALIGLSTALPTPWPLSCGRVGREQTSRLEALLEEPEVAGRTRVVLLHHGLRNSPIDPTYGLRSLWDARRLRRLLERRQVDLVLHGHNHVKHRRRTGRSDGVPVHTAPSTSYAGTRRRAKRSRVTIYSFAEEAGRWAVAEEHVWEPASGAFVPLT